MKKKIILSGLLMGLLAFHSVLAQAKKDAFYFSYALDKPYEIFLEVDSGDTTTWKRIEHKELKLEEMTLLNLSRNTRKYVYKDGKFKFHLEYIPQNYSSDDYSEFIFDPTKHQKTVVSIKDLTKEKIYTLHSDYHHDKRYWLCKKYIKKNNLASIKKSKYRYYYGDCFKVYMLEKINDREYIRYEVNWHHYYDFI